MKLSQNALKWLLLLILTFTWGTSFILIKKGVEYFHPLQVGSLRVAIAGLILFPFGIKNFKLIPTKIYPWIILSGLLGNFIPMFLFPLAEVKISSSLAGILNSLTPIFVVILGFLIFNIKSNKFQIVGTIIGFIGAFLLIYFSNNLAQTQNHESHYLYISYIVLASICYAFSALIIKKYLIQISSFKLSTVVFSILFFPSIIMLFYNNFYSEFIFVNQTKNAFLGLGYVTLLGILGTGIAMILFYKLIQISSTIFASSVTYVIPIVALVLGMLDGEELKPIHFIGMVIILAGVYIIQFKKSS